MVVGSMAAKSRAGALSSRVAVATSSPMRSRIRTAPATLRWARWQAVTEGPAFVRNGRMDLLAANRLARAFYAGRLTGSRPRRPDALCGTTPRVRERRLEPPPGPWAASYRGTVLWR